MKISCVQWAHEIGGWRPEVIVFPERIDPKEIDAASRLCPEAMIVAAIVDEGMSRGILRHRGRNQIDYLKVGSDGFTAGSGNILQTAVYETDRCCVGVLICMDSGRGQFSYAVTEQVRASAAPLKLVCIPGAMSGHWFQGDTLNGPRFDGMHVALCNNIDHQVRCQSFVTDTKGRKIAVQNGHEPLHVSLPWS